jgi:hypothetical protein
VTFIQNLDVENNNIFSFLILTDLLVLTGHEKYGRLSIWQWEQSGNYYSKIKTAVTYYYSGM